MVLEGLLVVSVHKDRWDFLDCQVPWVRKGLPAPTVHRALKVLLELQVRRGPQVRPDRSGQSDRLPGDRSGPRICFCRLR